MDVFELLKSDHEKVSNIFEQIDSLSINDGRRKRELFAQLKQELDLHAHLEETIFYPVLKQSAQTREITMEAYEEHQEVKDILAELQTLSVDDEEWNDAIIELRESVDHHVEEEETEMFQQARAILSQQQVDELGQRIQAAKQQQQTKSASART